VAGHFPGNGVGAGARDADLQAAVMQLSRTHRLPVAVGNASKPVRPEASSRPGVGRDRRGAPSKNPVGELIGILALTGCGPGLDPDGPAMVSGPRRARRDGVCQNAQSFQRIERSNRHWEEMFDAN